MPQKRWLCVSLSGLCKELVSNTEMTPKSQTINAPETSLQENSLLIFTWVSLETWKHVVTLALPNPASGHRKWTVTSTWSWPTQWINAVLLRELRTHSGEGVSAVCGVAPLSVDVIWSQWLRDPVSYQWDDGCSLKQNQHRAKLSLSRWVTLVVLSANISRQLACITSHSASESGGEPAKIKPGSGSAVAGQTSLPPKLVSASQPATKSALIAHQFATITLCSAKESASQDIEQQTRL